MDIIKVRGRVVGKSYPFEQNQISTFEGDFLLTPPTQSDLENLKEGDTVLFIGKYAGNIIYDFMRVEKCSIVAILPQPEPKPEPIYNSPEELLNKGYRPLEPKEKKNETYEKLVSILFAYCGEKGNSEGAVDTLLRLEDELLKYRRGKLEPKQEKIEKIEIPAYCEDELAHKINELIDAIGKLREGK